MLQAFATSHNRRVSLVFLAVAVGFLIAAAIAGINDNLPGIGLAMLASLSALLALVHPWRSEPPFRHLLWGSLAALVPCGILEGLLETVAGSLHPGSVLQMALQTVAVGLFFVVLFVLPPAFLVGFFGTAVMHFRGHRSRA
jgi:hypothetical protein